MIGRFSSVRFAKAFVLGSFSLLSLTAVCRGLGGGGTGGATGSATGGGHGGGSSTGGGHTGGGGQSSSGNPGTHAGTNHSGAFGSSVGHADGLSPAHFNGLVPTGFSSRPGAGANYPNVASGYPRPIASGYGGTLRAPYNNAQGQVNDGPGFTMSRSFEGGTNGGALRVGRANPQANATQQIRNAWTEPNNPHVNPAVRALRPGRSIAYDQDRAVLQNRATAGQHLYPGAAGYSTRLVGRSLANRSINEQDIGRRTREVYNRFYFTSLYYPYLYGSFFPVYAGYFSDGYGFGDYTGTDNNPSYNTPITGEVTGTYNHSSGDQDYQGPTRGNEDTPPPSDGNLPPNQPSLVGPPRPSLGQAPMSPENGPDTLVESVQDELAKRGYYGGKVDSMYNEATRVAIKRFQSDQQLAITGRINEATLHALQLD